MGCLVLSKLLRSKWTKTISLLTLNIVLYMAMTILTNNPVIGLIFFTMVSYYTIKEFLVPELERP